MFVLYCISNTRGQAVMPEAAVTHDTEGALLMGYHQGRGAGRPQAIAGNGVTDVEWSHGGEGMATNIHTHLQLAVFLFQQFNSGEERAFRAAGTQAGRPLRYQLGQFFPALAIGLFQRRYSDGSRFPLQ